MMRKALFWTFSAQLVSFAVLFLGSVVVARFLSPHEMGIFAVSAATIGILQIIASFGVGNYVIRATEFDDAMLNTAFTVNAVIGTALSVAIYAVSFFGARFLAEPAVAIVMHWLALVPLIALFEFRPTTMLQRELQFKRIAFVTTAQAVVSTTITIVAAVTGAGYLSPAFGAIGSAATGVIGYSVVGRRHVAWRMSTSGWRVIAAFGLRMMSIGGVSALSARVAEVILGHFLGLAALGLFGRASNLSNLIFSSVYGTTTRVIFAKLSADYRATGRLRETYLQGVRFLTAIMGPILIGLAILAKPAMLILYGSQWIGAALPLSLLMIAQFITLRYAMNWELFVIKDELKVQTRIEFVRAIFSLVSRTVGSLWSLTTVALSVIVDGVFAIALYGRHINRMIDTSERELLRVYGESILLTAAATFPALCLMLWSDWDEHTPVPLVALAIGLGVVAWLGALAWRKHPLFAEVTRLLHLLGERSKRSNFVRATTTPTDVGD